MKIYDYAKAKRLIEEAGEKLQSASLGMHEDWFWTADEIWADGTYKMELSDDVEIGGIKGSSWATPTLQLYFKDGSDLMKPCYTGESLPDIHTAQQRAFVTSSFGCLSSPCQDNITPLSE